MPVRFTERVGIVGANWLLPSLSEILHRWDTCDASDVAAGEAGLGSAERATVLWHNAIAAAAGLLRQSLLEAALAPQPVSQHLILCGPQPVFSDNAIPQQVPTWVFAADPLLMLLGVPLHLLPSQEAASSVASVPAAPRMISLLDMDPLAQEQFCLILGPEWSLLLLLGRNAQGNLQFQFSFAPEVIQLSWQALLLRIRLTNISEAKHLERALEQAGHRGTPIPPDFRAVSRFTQRLLQNLPLSAEFPKGPEVVVDPGAAPSPPAPNPTQPPLQEPGFSCIPPSGSDGDRPDLELLRAIAHEIRTPLATIRTLTRLLLRRRDLAPEVLKRLETIDNECTEQIDRFGLIYKAAELETEATQTHRPLTPLPLAQVLQDGVPRWQKQASRRNLSLDWVLPAHMPTVVSDPTMLDQALTGLIDRYTRHLPSGSHIEVVASLAGNQLKLQFQSQPTAPAADAPGPQFKSLGQLLMFQPETGSVSLNLQVTKNFFQALGGRLLVKERSRQGEVLTVYLPLDKGTL